MKADARTKSRSRWIAGGTALAALLASGAATAKTTERYVAEHDGVRIEISAPRADIIRVRAGQGMLPTDESWAVSDDVRDRLIPLHVSENKRTVELRTSDFTVRLDRDTLAMTIVDRRGNIVLADASGDALDFANGGFTARKVMPQDAHYFGLGDKTGPLDRRNHAYTFWNTDSFAFGTGQDPLYKSIPFVLGLEDDGESFGLFMDNTFRGFFDFGKRERDAFAFGAEGGPVDYYVMTGPNPKDIVEDYGYLTGTAPLAPMWALGFQQSHWSYMTQGEAKGIADRLRKDRIPADVLYLDIDYQDRNRPFTVNTKAFPDLPGLVSELKDAGMHLVLITDMHIANAPGEGYAAFDSLKASDLYVKNPDGTPYVAPVWPGPSIFPDFAQEAARDWWGEQYGKFVDMGVVGFWNDMNEPAIFETPTKTMPLDVVETIDSPGFETRETTQAELHNVYGMLNSMATYRGVREFAPDTRPFVLTRASYAGGQRYAATWTGDNVSSWAHLDLSISQLVSLGLSGFSYAGDDIGGFAGDGPSPDLLTRWIEIGAFNPIFRDHYQKDKARQEPWVDGKRHLGIRRRYIEERYRLMPYIYALADKNARTGLPLMRPVFLEFPSVVGEGDRLGGTAGQFMLGPDLLIAPPITWESATSYTIPLPGTGWYDYWSGARIDAEKVTETPTLERLPVFVRPGSILPKQPLVQSTGITPQGRLELNVYPGENCTGSLYLDDGVSFAYTRGDYLRQTVRCDANGLSFAAREGRYKPWWSGFDIVVHGWNGAAPKVMLGGKAVPARVDAKTHTLHFTLPDIATPAKVTFSR